MRDPITGKTLCEHCWNGAHWTIINGKKNSVCEQCLPDGRKCECFCRQMLAEEVARQKAKAVETRRFRPSPAPKPKANQPTEKRKATSWQH